MLLKTKLFEKELFWPSFFVLCSFKNICEQFIIAHIVSWHFFCIIKLHFVRTYEADGDFSKKMLPSRWFWPVFSRITEYRDIRKQFHWPKEYSNSYFASYKIISATTEWIWIQKFSKKSYFSSEKKRLLHFLSYYRVLQTSITILSRSIKYSSKIGASKKVKRQRPDKLLKTNCFEKKR